MASIFALIGLRGSEEFRLFRSGSRITASATLGEIVMMKDVAAMVSTVTSRNIW